MLNAEDWSSLLLSLKLGSVVTFLLVLVSLPLSWWLAHSCSRMKPLASTVIALPLVLPPTILGFYFLLLLGPNGAVGHLTLALGLGTLPFTFPGLVVASVFYSLPFVVQPLTSAFERIGHWPMEVASTLRAGPVEAFFTVIIPMTIPDLIAASILGFAHTLGEFGIVLMIGGNIPGVTRVASVQIYNHAEALEYGQAHWLSGTMIVLSLVLLFLVQKYGLSRKQRA